jgi:eukaryotic-like serine/threonine-protein kinase
VTQIERFGKYILLEKIATGGMAEIYLARAPGASGINKYVAIKRILPQYSDNPEFVEMFKSEAKIAINLKHSNIVSIFEFGVEKGQFFLVMDFVEGKNLRQIINRMKQVNKSFSLDQILFIIREAGAGLDSAHRCLDGNSGRPLNITHRDISPQNVMISYEGEIKIVDFGIAKTETQIEATKAGTLKGKFGYMSPEQAEGIQVDLRTDVFSLGIVLWELVANDRLFMANNEMNTLRKIRECQVPSLRKINSKVPEDLEKIVNKALAKDRNLRYQTAAALHRDLNTFLNKNYPTFSQHDFGNVIKTLFSDEIVTVRNKLVDYSKIEINDLTPSPAVEETTKTLTTTETPVPPKMQMPQSTSVTATQPITQQTITDTDVNFKDLVDSSLQQRNVTSHEKINSAGKGTLTQSLAQQIANANRKHRPNPGMRTGSMKIKPNFFDQLRNVIPGPTLMLLLVLIGGFFWTGPENVQKFTRLMLKHSPPTPLSSPDKTCEGDDCESSGASKEEQYKVSITSNPPGAAIILNDRDIGKITPALVDLPAKKTHAITLKLAGYLIYRTEYTADKPSDALQALLQKTVEGYLNIRVFPNNAIIFINKEPVPGTPPFNRYAVPANKQLVVRAVDKWTGAEATETVYIEENRVKTVELFLNKK